MNVLFIKDNGEKHFISNQVQTYEEYSSTYSSHKLFTKLNTGISKKKSQYPFPKF